MEIISAAAGYLIHFKRSTNTLKQRIQQLTATKNDVQARIDAALRNGEIIEEERVKGWMITADLVIGEATELIEEARVINSWYRGWWSSSRFSLGRKAEKKIPIIQRLCDDGRFLIFGDYVSYQQTSMEFGYMIHFRRSINTLNEKIKQLTDMQGYVQAHIDAATRNVELIFETVQEWMTRVDLVLSQATELSNEASVFSSWFRGWCCSRFSLGWKAQKKIHVIQQLCEEAGGFGNMISYRKPTQSLNVMGMEDFNAFASRDYSTTEDIHKALLNDPINLVGVHGMPGVGKTSLIKPTQKLNLVGTEDFNAFASRESTAEEICKAILDDATNLLGVHGMPGVGKTALIKAITKQVEEEQLFEEVVMVVVSWNPSLIKLQGDIAKSLGLSLDEDNLSRRAELLWERLNQDHKTLVILDDVWESIKLSEIGIPYKNKGKCCKVVFTTRDQGVCDKMEADAKMEVAILSEEDSWILFCQISGNVEDSSLARDLLNECKGLPLAIVTLGISLRNKNPRMWNAVLLQLRNSIFEGMSYVVSSIKLSYDFLKSESVKKCFLFCCLFPENYVIELEVLLSYVMGEKVLEDVVTYDEARGRLQSILDILASSSLLLRDGDGGFMMHDVVRDMAISIATEDHGFIVKAGRNLSEWPYMKLGNCKRLSMMDNNIMCLPSIPIKAPHLQTLFLNNNRKLKELPSDVFAEMKCLMTLDLSDTKIKSLPPSLSYLQNLRTLLLNKTDLTNLSPIDKLEKLEVLSLCNSRTNLEEFPEEMGNLSNLKVLDLTNTSFTNSINPNLISKLHRLETFHLFKSNVYQPKPNFEELEFFREIGSLSRLTSLELPVLINRELWYIDIPGPWQNLTRFQMRGINFEASRTTDRGLWFEGIRGKQVANWVWVLLGGAKGMNHDLKFLRLSWCPKMECLLNNTGLLESNSDYEFSQLEELVIEDMNAFVEIYKGTNPPTRFLCKLKKLSLGYCVLLLTAIPRKLIHNLLNLESLRIQACRNLLYVVHLEEEEEESVLVSNIRRISEPIFPNLKKFSMWDMPKITYVFTMRVTRNLLHLEQLEIGCCLEMEVILKYEDGEDIKCNEEFKDTAILPRLKKLTVRDAPELQSFTNQNLVMEFPSLEYLDVLRCGMLERLPFDTTSVPNLNTYKMEQDLFERLDWEDESVKERLQNMLPEFVH